MRPAPKALARGAALGYAPRWLVSTRIGLLLLMFSAVSATFALVGRGLWLLLLWPSASWLVVALGYLHLGPRVLGKRPDGTLPWLTQLLLLPHFALTHLGWLAMRLSPEPHHHEVAPGIFLGRRPRLADLPEGVALVVDMTAEFPPAAGVLEGRAYLCLPTLDGGLPDEQACARLVDEVSRFSGSVYIHCAYGHGRSAVVAGAALVRRGIARSADEAVTMMRAARPLVRMSQEQRALMARLASAVR